ncbi:MAG: HD domain-containing protein [Acutalibacteraceae bacterium]|nr:HD domain-containing protein [Acutalibacteraceae bacterium]
MNFTPLGSTNSHEGYCLIKTVEKKLTAKGVPYLDMTLADNSGEINAKLWDYKESPLNQFNALDFVKVRGTYVPFNDTMQFRVERIRNVIPEDNVAIEDYVPSACLTGQVMLAEIEKIVASFRDAELKSLVGAVIEKYSEKLLYWPAAKNLHHAVRSGLLMHTLSILRLARGVCSIYRFVNYDLLCAGAILHDIAKIDEMQATATGIAAEYTVKGNLLGHLVMGAINIDRIGRELGISDETLTLVEHMLISHHGTPEFGAAKMPMFIEAELLSQLDLMDARLYEMHAAVEAVDEGAFTPRQWALENRNLYNHGKAYDGGVELMNEEEIQ